MVQSFNDMINTIVEKVKGFLINPVETFQQSKNDETVTVFSFFGILLLIHAVLSAIIAGIWVQRTQMFAGMPWVDNAPVMVFFFVLVGGFICTLIFAAWLHLWVYLLGGRKGIMQTVNAIIYGHTPRLLLGWIPFVGFIFMLWSLVLSILGIRELHEMSTIKAILAVAIAVMIPVILLILVAAYFITTNMVISPVPHPMGNTL